MFCTRFERASRLLAPIDTPAVRTRCPTSAICLQLASFLAGREHDATPTPTVSHPLLSVPVGLLEGDHEPGHECYESECQPRRPRCKALPNPPPQLAELITERCPPFRFEDRNFVVVVTAICGKRPECRLALAAGVFELRPNVLPAKFLFAALVVACDLVHEEFRDEATSPAFRTVVQPKRWRSILAARIVWPRRLRICVLGLSGWTRVVF